MFYHLNLNLVILKSIILLPSLGIKARVQIDEKLSLKEKAYNFLTYADGFFPSSWQNDVFVVAEPGGLADRFLQSVKMSLLSMVRSHQSKAVSQLSNISTVADLVSYKPYFQIGCVVHRYIGRQTQVWFLSHCHLINPPTISLALNIVLSSVLMPFSG